jgi:hypothetical protein
MCGHDRLNSRIAAEKALFSAVSSLMDAMSVVACEGERDGGLCDNATLGLMLQMIEAGDILKGQRDALIKSITADDPAAAEEIRLRDQQEGQRRINEVKRSLS